MTTEQVKGYKAYWQNAKQKAQYEFYRTSDEKYNDAYVFADDMIDCMELALCQLYENEGRRKGING